MIYQIIYLTNSFGNSYYIEDDNLVIINGSSGDTISKENFKYQLNNLLNDISSSNNYITPEIQKIEPEFINIDKIYTDIYTEPVNAYYQENPFKIYPEVVGISFDKDYAKELIKTEQSEYTIPLTITNPNITTADLDINIFRDLLSKFTTKYDVSNTDRANNLEIAAKKINGTIIAPGETFSYNKIVGARTIAAGYKEAKVYSNGEVVDGIGGGICQISSTIYNAAIYANLDVKERHNHQFITSYVPAGRDATVVYGSKDLKFVNNRSYPIKIDLKVLNGIVYCYIYGLKEENEYTIDFDIEDLSTSTPEIKYEQDSSLSPGSEIIKQKGANGKAVNVYKITKLNGAIISKTFISNDIYKPLDKIIYVNSN